MRIVMIGPFGFHPNKTMHSRAFKLAQAFVRRGHQVKIVMPPWQTPEEANRAWVEAGVDVCYVALHGGLLAIVGRMGIETLAYKPDVVYGFKPKAYSGLVMWWLWQFHRHHLRLVTDTDDWEGWGGWNDLAPYSPLQKRFFAGQEQWGLRHNHALTVASRALQQMAWGLGVPRDRVIYLPNGAGIRRHWSVDIGQSEIPTVLLYSRLFEFDTARLVDILKGVTTAVANLRILSVGSGLYADDAVQLRQQFADAGLLNIVDDVGWIDVEQLPDVLSQAHVGIYLMEESLLNRTKCPVKLADMIALGIPVVAEAVGQVPEYVIDGVNGRLHSSGDRLGLTQSLIDLLQNSTERARLGRNGRQHYTTHFDWDILAQKLEHALT